MELTALGIAQVSLEGILGFGQVSVVFVQVSVAQNPWGLYR